MNIDISGMTDNHLRPCPECHSTRVKLRVRVAYRTHWYECQRCGYRPDKMGEDIAEAVKIWNEMMAKG